MQKYLLVLIMAVALLIVSCTSENQSIKKNDKNLVKADVLLLNEAKASQSVELSNGDIFHLDARPVKKKIEDIIIKMYAYNGQIPGPLLKVNQGSTIFINFTNNIDADTTIHWHGIRLENKFDGVPNITQLPVKPSESFLYKLDFPDEGVYWYHTHLREDLQQELGLYGNIFVEPKDINYFNSVDKEVFLFLDDIKMAKGDVDIFRGDFARFALMGRFGNVMMLNGETDYKLNLKRGEIVRFYLTDSANTRTFNFSIEKHKLKLVGSDSGKFEKEELKDSVIISPAERYIVEVLFDQEGTFNIIHRTPSKTYVLGTITVSQNEINNNVNFYSLKENNDIKENIDKFKKYFDKKPDFEIDLTVYMGSMQMEHGMMQMESNEEIEWEDDMTSMNAMTTSKNIKWIIKDKKTGKENMDINYKVKVGEIKKIRIFNDPKSMHPMQHPMHLHGQRFLVLGIDNKPTENFAWKDTVLVPKGSTVDILIEFTNPGDWMMHCHIAEHLESGMMSMFMVT